MKSLWLAITIFSSWLWLAVTTDQLAKIERDTEVSPVFVYCQYSNQFCYLKGTVMIIHVKVILERRDRLAIAHSQGLSIASTKEDCQAAIHFAVEQYLQFVGIAYTKHIGKNEKPDQEKSNGQ